MSDGDDDEVKLCGCEECGRVEVSIRICLPRMGLNKSQSTNLIGCLKSRFSFVVWSMRSFNSGLRSREN